MKKYFLFLFVAVTFLSGCTSNAKVLINDPQAYDSYIENLLKRLEKTEKDLGSSYATGLSSSIESTYQNSLSQVKTLKKSIDSLDAFKGDPGLQAAASKYLGFFQAVYEKEYREIVDIMKKPGITELEKKRFEEIYNTIDNNKNELKTELMDERLKFYEKYLGKK